MVELRECWCCGSTEHLEVKRSDEMRIQPHPGADLGYAVMCAVAVGGRGEDSGCGASCGFYASASEAVTAWNTRASDAEIARLMQTIRQKMVVIERQQDRINELEAHTRAEAALEKED